MEPLIALFCNPSSDNARALRMTDEVGLHLKRRGIPFMAFTDGWPASLSRFTQVWIVGGDGTLNYFINQFPDVRVPLAAIPGGSGNDFHWMLYNGELALPQLVERLLQGNTRAIDAGSCNGRLFLNGLGIGFDGAIVRDLLGKKKLAGKASYLLSVLKHILTYQESSVGVLADGTEYRKNALLLSVANGTRYGGDFLVAPKTVPDDGLLDINFVGAIAPLQRMRYLPVIERGEHLELPFVWYRQAADIVIECAQELPAHLDGEYLKAARFEVRCLPKKFVFFV
ncbi:diacylglycerol/lipid kinase family protein [Flaviaesturariibacter flavus]|nr:YegS/Rv2252/BmrU family lipid kinase [Flaviaesturariibacter flavus]